MMPGDTHHDLVGEPVTDNECKRVMLRSERGDTIDIDGDEYTVEERTDPYFGPKLKLSGPDGIYMLTAPGPDTQLLLWESIVNDDGFREGWRKLREVKAEIVGTKKYDICQNCGEPIKNAQHQRLAVIGACEP